MGQLIDCVVVNDMPTLVGHFVSSPRERKKIVEKMKEFLIDCVGV